MVCVYDIGNEQFNGMGNAVLMPTVGRMRQAAGGSYDLTMTHPVDQEGKWEHLVPGAILQIPVPEETIENAFTGMEQWIYTSNQQIVLRESASEPTTVNYPAWSGNNEYTAGSSCVTYNSKNYKCVTFDTASGERFVPPNNSSWWTEISRTSGGSPAVATIPAGTQIWWVSGSSSDTWWKMSTEWGVEGYCKQSLLTEYAHLLPEETEARVIRTQLFRIKTATIDTVDMTVQVEAEHVSYDLRGNIVKEVSISGASPATAVYKVTNGLMMELKGTVATNLTSEDGTYTGTFRGKNGVFCLLDPDSGLAGAFDAAVKRDNWDTFLMKKTHPDRGFRLRYRKNARGINWNRDAGSLITRVVPVAKDSDGSELYLDSPFVDSPYIENYPVIRMEKLQVSGQVGKDDGSGTGSTWTKAGLQAEMQSQAEERFSVDQADRIAEEITIDFTQLGDTIDEPELKHLEMALLYDRVKVIDERVGLVRDLDVTEIEWDFIHKRLVGLVLSNVSIYGGKATVSGYTVQNSSITLEKLDTSVLSSIYNAQSKMENWLLSLQNDDGTIRNNIRITEAGLQADLSDAVNGLTNSISVTAAGIRSDMADDKAGLQATITATASQLRTEYQTADGTLQSSITEVAGQITAEVTRATGAESSIAGRVTVTERKVGMVVEETQDGDVIKAAEICVAINESEESEAIISAEKVYIGQEGSITYISGELSAIKADIADLQTDTLTVTKLANLPLVEVQRLSTTGDIAAGSLYGQSIYLSGATAQADPFNIKNFIKAIQVVDSGTVYTLQYKNQLNPDTWVNAGTFSRAAAQSYTGAWSGDNTGDTATFTVLASPGSVQIAQSSVILHINSQAAWVTDPDGTIRARVDNTQYAAGWIAAANAVAPPAAAVGEVTSFSVTVPANTGAGDTTPMTFSITKGTPSASGGYAAVNYNNQAVGRISLDDWWDAGFDAVTLSGSWAHGDTGTGNTWTVAADDETDGTAREVALSVSLSAGAISTWSNGNRAVRLYANGTSVANITVSMPAASAASWDKSWDGSDYYVTCTLGGRVMNWSFGGSQAYGAGWAAAEDDFSAPTTTPATIGASMTVTGPNSTVDGTPVSVTYTLSSDSSYVYLKAGANVVARTANTGASAMSIGTPTWANGPSSTGSGTTWGTSNTLTVPTADGNDSVSFGLYLYQGSTWTSDWIRNTYIRLNSASGQFLAKMPVDASGVYTSGHNAGRDAVTVAGLSWTTGSNSSSTRQMQTSTSGRYTSESTNTYELVIKNGSDNDTVVLTVDNLATSSAAAQRMAFTHGQYTAGWRAAYGVWGVPAAGTAATCTFTFPAYANNTTTTRTYTLSETNSYCYLKDPNGNTVARITNGAYDAGYTSGYDIGYAAGKLDGWHAFWDDKPDWIEAWDEGGGVYSVWTPKREPPEGWIGDGSSSTCVKWFEYSTSGSHSPSASGLARQSVQAGDDFISGCRHLSTPWTEPSSGGMYYKFTVTCGGSSAKYYFKV